MGHNMQHIFSLENLIAWLERQPADMSYNWASFDDCPGCLITQYLHSHRLKFRDGYPRICHELGGRIVLAISARYPWTFGAALERACAILEKREPK